MSPSTTGAAKTAAGGSSVRGRTKHEQDQLQRKTVYRPVLDNPLTIAWPPLPASIRKSILEHLVAILNSPQGQGQTNKTVAEWRAEEHAARRGRTPGKGKGKGKGKAKDQDSNDMQLDQGEGEGEAKELPAKKIKVAIKAKSGLTHEIKTRTSTYSIPTRTGELPTPKPPRTLGPRPPILDYLSVGINEVTKALETRIRWARWELGDSTAVPGYSRQLKQASKSPSSSSSHPALIPTAPTTLPARRPSPPSFDPNDLFDLIDEEYGPSSNPLTVDMFFDLSKKLVAPPPAPELSEAPLAPKSGRKRLRKKSNPTMFSPLTALNLVNSIDYSSLPGYQFLASPAPVPQIDRNPPYYLSPTENSPSPKLLLNSETLRISKAVKKGNVGNGAVKEKEKVKKVKISIVEEHEIEGVESTSAGQEEEEDEESQETQDLPPTIPLIDLVFVCKPDINPPSLVAHLPSMVAATNGAQQALEESISNSPQGKDGMEFEGDGATKREFKKVLLIPLDHGAERVLADALGLRRVAVIGLCSSAPGTTNLLNLLTQHLTPLSAPWLVPHLLNPSKERKGSGYEETRIKHLKTSAPLNPKAANQKKKEVRKEKKEKERREKKGEGEVYEAED